VLVGLLTFFMPGIRESASRERRYALLDEPLPVQGKALEDVYA